MAAQASLQNEWLHGKRGGLSAREQMKVWALREVWNDHHDTVYGMHVWIAARVTQVGGGNPTNAAITDLLMKMDADEDLSPVTQYGETRGRKRVLTGVQALAVANCAQTKKNTGWRPDIRPRAWELSGRGHEPSNRQACG